MAAMLHLDIGQVTKLRHSGVTAKNAALYLTISDGESEFDCSADVGMEAEVRKFLMKPQEMTVSIVGSLFQSENSRSAIQRLKVVAIVGKVPSKST